MIEIDGIEDEDEDEGEENENQTKTVNKTRMKMKIKKPRDIFFPKIILNSLFFAENDKHLLEVFQKNQKSVSKTILL